MPHLIHGLRTYIYIAKIVLYPKHHYNYLAENACIMWKTHTHVHTHTNTQNTHRHTRMCTHTHTNTHTCTHTHMHTHAPLPPPYTLSIKDVGQDPENDAGAQCQVPVWCMTAHHAFLSFTVFCQLGTPTRSLLTTSIQCSGVPPGLLLFPCGLHL